MRLLALTAAALIVLVLSWDAPVTTCKGEPLTDLDHYEVPTMRVSILGWRTCAAEDGSTYACPMYAWTFARERTQETTIALADPAVGEVLGYGCPEAFDLCGQGSSMCSDPDWCWP